MEVLSASALWRGGSPGHRALLSAAWRGALVPTALYALATAPAVAFGRLRGDPGLGWGVVLTAVSLTYLLTAAGLATLGATAFLLLARVGRAGAVPFALSGAAAAAAAGLLARTSVAVDGPLLLLLALHGATAAAAMWYRARRAR